MSKYAAGLGTAWRWLAIVLAVVVSVAILAPSAPLTTAEGSTNLEWQVLDVRMPQVGYNFGATVGPDNKVYVIGGSNGWQSQKWLWSFDPVGATWNTGLAQKPNFGGGWSIRVGEFIYTTGRPAPTTVVMERYEPAKNEWTILPGPTAQLESGGAVLDGKIYSVGGRLFDWVECPGIVGRGGHCWLKTVQRYDPSDGSWTRLQDLPVYLSSLTAASAGGYVYAIGGVDKDFYSQKSVYRYDPVTDQWTQVADMLESRAWAQAVAASNGRIYVVGGDTIDPNAPSREMSLASVEEYNPATNTWTRLSDIPQRTHAAAMVEAGGKLFLFGGHVCPAEPGTNSCMTHDLIQVATIPTDVPPLAIFPFATFVGESPAGWLGRGIADGDLTGDGYNDLLLPASRNSEAGIEAGKIYLYLGPCLTPKFTVVGEHAGDTFGARAEYIGDVNADGYDDLAVQASGYDLVDRADVGRVYIFYGGPSLENIADLVMTGDPSLLGLGFNISKLGDINGDGFDDWAFANRSHAYGFDRGLVDVYYGGPGVDGIPDMRIPPQGSDIFGASMIEAGDTNGDGYPDLLISSWDGRNGSAYLYFGGPEMDTVPDVTFDEGGGGELYYGAPGLASADVNNDGYNDLIIGARGIGSGRVFIYYGGVSVNNVADAVLQGEHDGDGFGYALTSLGDINGDGYEDIATNATWNDEGGPDAGKVYVYLGGNPMDTVPDLVLVGEAAGDRFGSVTSGDLNADGVSELIVGAIENDEGGPDAGKVYIYTFRPPNSSPLLTTDQSSITVYEGQTAINSGTVSDPDNDAIALRASVGTVTNNGDGTWSWSFATSDGPAQSQPVTIYADDARCGTNQATFDLGVNNVLPTVGPIAAPLDPVQINTAINTSAQFADPGVLDTHTATWDWGDGSSSQGTVNEAGGSGSVIGNHTYTTAGVYTLKLTVTDDDSGSGESIFQYVVIYDPSAGFVTGGGWINSPPGAYTPDNPDDPDLTGKATFGFVSKYQKSAQVPSGQTEFQFKVADLNFHSTSYQWLVVAGAKAQYKGSGTINGTGDYGFMLTAVDGQINAGGGTDKFRIKIWDNATGDMVYDNQAGAADTEVPTTELGGGSIVIHKG